MKKIFLLIFVTFVAMANAQDIPKVSSGTIERIEDFHSNFIDNRRIDIWLPENYSKEKKYAVLYMQDGQMLFDPTTTWNKQAWEIDNTITQLASDKKIKECIVVGIWNGGKVRHATYFPQKAFELLSDLVKKNIEEKNKNYKTDTEKFQPNSDNYLKFLVKELKPYIDFTYSTNKDLSNTFIGGSSMGGLISLYAICEYPEVFGGAICMSTHWPGFSVLKNNPVPLAFQNYLKNNLPNPKNHKIYFDFGDKTLDETYAEHQTAVDKIMTEKGFTSTNWMTKFFEGDDHSEKSWNNRVHFPLEFMLPNN
jgi:predicted alpha/beta superfamily hydrolase